jgi:ATP-dependent Clp protease protease subunit
MAASMGQFLLTSGAKGKRFSTKSSRILMHQPLGGIGGNAIDIRIQAEQMAITKQTLSELNALNTGQTLEKILADSDRDNWFNAEDAKEYGFVDHVVTSMSQITGGKA